MRILFSAVVCLLLCIMGIAPSSGLRAAKAGTQTDVQAPAQSPFACDRLALDPVARSRHFDELGPQLRSMKTGVRELSNGYAFKFPADMKTVQLVAEWAAGERLCCPFFDIEIKLEPEGGPMWLTMTGREGTKRFMQVDAPEWLK
jgi:hypothetical protein